MKKNTLIIMSIVFTITIHGQIGISINENSSNTFTLNVEAPPNELNRQSMDFSKEEDFYSFTSSAIHSNFSKKKIDLDDLSYYLEQSEVFDEGTSFFWLEYQMVSNRGKREDFKKNIVPPIGINYEARLFHNLGLKASLSLHYWKEDKVLAESSLQEYIEEFNYLYHTASLGLNWHIAISEYIDPYFGIHYSYRHLYAACDCISDKNTDSGIEFLLGGRYMMSDHYFFNAEIGHTGTGYFKVGMGYRFGDF